MEKLCARALRNAGATHIRRNLKIRWNEENEIAILKHKNDKTEPYSTEIDVLASFLGDLVLVSVKSYELKDAYTDEETEIWKKDDSGRHERDLLTPTAQEAHNVSTYLGSFALALVTDMGSCKRTTEDGTIIIGLADICQPDILAGHITALRRSRSSTTE